MEPKAFRTDPAQPSILQFLVRTVRSDSGRNPLEQDAMGLDHVLAQHENTPLSPSEGPIDIDGWLDPHTLPSSVDTNIVPVTSNQDTRVQEKTSNQGTRAQGRVLLSPCGGEPPLISQRITTCQPGRELGVGSVADDQDRYRAGTITTVLLHDVSGAEPDRESGENGRGERENGGG